MIIKIYFRNEECLFHLGGLNPLYELIDRDYLLTEFEISEIETVCEEKLKDSFPPEMIYEAIDRKATFGLYDKNNPYDVSWYALSNKPSLEEAKKEFEKVLNDENFKSVRFSIFDFENMSIIDIEIEKDVSIKEKDGDAYSIETENYIFVGDKKGAEEYIYEVMEMNDLSVLDVFSYFKIYKNGEAIMIKEFFPILP